MAPDATTLDRLAATRTIDLTTTGRRTGRAARIEIWWFRVDERFVVTGTPGPRDWFANVLADPRVIIHAPFGEFNGRAVPIDDPDLRRQVMTDPQLSWYSTQSGLDELVRGAPMIEVILEG